MRSEVAGLVASVGEGLAREAGLRIVEVDPALPALGGEWSLASTVGTFVELLDLYPDCETLLTREIRGGVARAVDRYDLKRAARVEKYRMALNEAMATMFERADLVICASNPDVAFAAEGPPPLGVGGTSLVDELGLTRAAMNNAALTACSNLTGNPAVSLPAGTVDGLPVGLQVLAPHHHEPVLLELAQILERSRPWPLVAPGAPS